MQQIPDHIPVIADAKRGDIGNTARRYAYALFEVFDCDAATVNPYLGFDSIQPFIDYEDKGVFILCHTSNPSAVDFQYLPCSTDGHTGPMPLYELVALKASEWDIKQNIGLVVGATRPTPIKRVREICPNMPLLIPGIGPQKGGLASAVRFGADANGRNILITSSRQVIYASSGKDFFTAARLEASKLRTRINQYLAKKSETDGK